MDSTKEIKVPKRILDQVIGQDEAVDIIKKAAQQRRHVLLIGEPGTGKCVGQNTLLLTEEGPKKAKELFKSISNNNLIINKKGEIYAATKENVFVYSIDKKGKICKKRIILAYKGKKKKCLKITTSSGAELILSGEHPLLTTAKGRLFFLESTKLNKNSKIGSARQLLLLKDNNIPFGNLKTDCTKIWNEKNKTKIQYKGKNEVKSLALTVPKKITKELAYFLGIFVAEGSYQSNIVIDNENKKIKQTIKNILKTHFDYPEQYFEESKKGLIIKRGRTLAHILEKCFNVSLVREKQASKKRVPSLIFKSDREIVANFISGYIDGDGYISKDRGLQAISSSNELIEGLRILFLHLGIQSRTRSTLKYASNTKEKRKRRYFELSIRDSYNLSKLSTLLYLKMNHKKDRLLTFLNKKQNTNVDIIPETGDLLSSLKNVLGTTFEELDAYPATFRKILLNERDISYSYFKNLTALFNKKFLRIQEDKNKLLQEKDYIDKIGEACGNFYQEIKKNPHIVSKRTIQRYNKRQIKPSFNTVCNLFDLKKDIKSLISLISYTAQTTQHTITKKTFLSNNPSLPVVQRIIKDYHAVLNEINRRIDASKELLDRINILADSDLYWDNITKIEEIYDDVYDFEIEDTHNLIVNNGLIVHNSMLGLALAELLPKEKLQDIISLPNPNDENTPLIRTVKAGKGREEVRKAQLDAKQFFKNQNFLFFILAIAAMVAPWWVRHHYKSDLMFTAFFLGGMLFLVGIVFMLNLGPRMLTSSKVQYPKLIVDNYGQKQSPFYDATGAHAGALLGDCLHDPFQCFCHSQVVSKIRNNTIGNVEINKEIDKLFSKHKKNIIKKRERNYEALHLPKNELLVLGETNRSVSPVEVLSSNRHDHQGEMIKLTTSENKELTVTPEHKVALWKNGKITYVEAKDVKEGDEVVAKTRDVIIDEQDVINTFDERQQKLAKSYYDYLNLRKQDSSWGYKRLATKLGVSYGRTRWWWDNHSAPVPVQTVEWLKKRGLLPLKIDNPKLPLITKVLGATFGDGGIFENLNAIFFSSSELEATQEFGDDLMTIFGYSIDNNMRTTRGGINETSFCYHNTNRKIIRFFKALGTPIGKKTTMNLIIPNWIKLNKELEREFYGSLFGSEIGISSDGKSGARIEFGISGEPKLESNRINFLNQIIHYLNKQGIAVGKIHNYNIKKYEGRRRIFRFILSQKLENIEKFAKSTKIHYCNYKKENLKKYLNKFEERTYKKYYLQANKKYG